MIARCLHPARRDFRWYGGRGIQIDPVWLAPPRGTGGFERFLSDMGLRPEGTTLDRIDINGHYEASNCRWATVELQVSNRQPGGYAAAADEVDELRYRESTGEYDPLEHRIEPKWTILLISKEASAPDDIPF